MQRDRWQRIFSLAAALAVMAVALAGLSPARTAVAQGGGPVWGEPVNLSQSGAAALPYMVAEPNGNLHVLWWDEFDGAKYAAYTPERGWTAPVSVRTISGGRLRTGEPLPPKSLELFVDSANNLQVFWTADDGDLLYARKRIGFGEWTNSIQLATAPLAWSAFADAHNGLHLAVIRATQAGTLAPGVYYRTSSNNGAAWENTVLVSESLYFRTLPTGQAHVNVSSDGGDNTFVIWDDPQLGQSTYTRPAEFGRSDEAPLVFEAGDVAGGAAPQRARILIQPDGSLMALWQAGVNCELYQQIYDPLTGAWSLPLRVLDSLVGCPTALRNYAATDGKQVLVLELADGGVTMAIWDGLSWSDPLASVISFVNPLTGRSNTLGCLKLSLTGDKVAALGCDENRDVWVTTSQVSVNDLLPALESAWSAPSLLSQSSGDAGLPAVTLDTDGIVHALWAEAPPDSNVSEYLSYVRGDGASWSASPKVLRSPEGKAEHPALVADPGGMLHAVWSGGLAGQIYYSQAFVRDAATAPGWSAPRALPSLQAVGDWPSLSLDEAGGLHLTYVIPLNENRGVYYLYSGDQGQTWTEPQLVFDAVAAGWSMVGEAHQTRDAAGRLHVMFTRNSLLATGQSLGVFYARSEDGGATWTATADVSAGAADHPRLIAVAADQIHRLWVVTSSGKLEVWHQTSIDGGATWSEAERALDSTVGVTADIGLATDGNGTVFMTGIQHAAESSDTLFSGRWDGQVWTDYERVPLGYEASDGAGTVTIMLPQGLLGAFYRVQAFTAGGTPKYAVGYTQRPVTIGEMVVVPTFTPPPPSTATAAPTVEPTLAPSPTPDLSDAQAPTTDSNFWIQLGGILAVMLVVSVLAVARLIGGRQ